MSNLTENKLIERLRAGSLWEPPWQVGNSATWSELCWIVPDHSSAGARGLGHCAQRAAASSHDPQLDRGRTIAVTMDIDVLERLHAAACPPQPSRIPSPPFPHPSELATEQTQNLLERRLLCKFKGKCVARGLPEEGGGDQEGYPATRWHLAFWKRVVSETEKGLQQQQLNGVPNDVGTVLVLQRSSVMRC